MSDDNEQPVQYYIVTIEKMMAAVEGSNKAVVRTFTGALPEDELLKDDVWLKQAMSVFAEAEAEKPSPEVVPATREQVEGFLEDRLMQMVMERTAEDVAAHIVEEGENIH